MAPSRGGGEGEARRERTLDGVILGIDTSLGTAVAIATDDGTTLAEALSVDPRGHAEVIGTLIERVLDGPYLELFARQRPNSHADWSVWGNEIDSDIVIPGYPVPSDFTLATRADSGAGDE